MINTQNVDELVLGKYEIVKKMGSGAYGHVWKVKSKLEEEKKFFALKKIFEAFQHATDAQRTYREVSILSKLKHPNVIRLQKVISSNSHRDIYLLFEFMSLDLHKAVYEGVLQQVHKKYVLYQILLGLHYLHSTHIIHRDLKPSNILMNEQCQAKICDFGMARLLSQQDQTNVLTQDVATRWYRAPELLMGSNSYDHHSDMWSFGCIMAEIYLKNPMFPGNSTLNQLEKILQFTGKPTKPEMENNSQYNIALIEQIPTVRTKKSKEWFGSLCEDTHWLDLINNLLCFNPAKRFNAKSALKHPFFAEFFNQKDLVLFEGNLELEVNDNIKLAASEYQKLISKHFSVDKNIFHEKKMFEEKVQSFSDLKKTKEKSFGKLIETMKIRKCSQQKQNKNKNKLFEEAIEQSRVKSQSQEKRDEGSSNKENKRWNINELQQFQMKSKQIGSNTGNTFASLKKTSNVASRFRKQENKSVLPQRFA